MLEKLFFVVFLTLVLNLPFGWLREGTEKFSKKWFLYIHLPIPFIIACRIILGISIKFAPVLIATAVVGQLVGGMIRRRYYPGGLYE
ncbi:hypothetical protein [Desulfurobacterium sp.]